jgi:biopolymer transport protein ExbB
MKFRIFFPIIMILLGILPLSAQSKNAGVEEPQALNLFNLFQAGGWVMYPMAVFSVAAASLCLLYLFTIRQNAVVSDRFMDNIETMIRSRDLHGLAVYCRRQSECMARITQRVVDFIIANPSVTLAEVREIAESEGSRQSGMMTSRVSYLGDIGNITPMLGLLGTVLGMIKSFHQLSAGQEGVKQMELTSGISVALVATASGLIIGISSMLAYAFFRTRTLRYIGELEAASSHLVALLQTLTVRSSTTASSTPRSDRAGPSTADI